MIMIFMITLTLIWVLVLMMRMVLRGQYIWDRLSVLLTNQSVVGQPCPHPLPVLLSSYHHHTIAIVIIILSLSFSSSSYFCGISLGRPEVKHFPRCSRSNLFGQSRPVNVHVLYGGMSVLGDKVLEESAKTYQKQSKRSPKLPQSFGSQNSMIY